VYSWQYKTIGNDPGTTEDDPFVGKSICHWLNGGEGAHSMTFVGYNDAVWVDINNNGIVDNGEKGALRIANSWGIGWKEGGFTWLAYDALRYTSAVSGAPTAGRRGALQSDSAYHLTVKENYEPKLLAEFTLNHLRRNQMRISLGVSDSNQTSPAITWYPDAINFDGGPYAFDGSTTAVEGTFIFDFTDIMPTYSDQRWYVGMYDSTAGDIATLISYNFIDAWHGDIISESYDVPQTADGGDQIHAWADYGFSDGNLQPHAEFSASPTVGDISLPVEFDASPSYDSDGSIVGFDWDFGDGSRGSGEVINHTYSSAGEFTATLTVTDDGSKTDMATIRVTVDDPNTLNAPTNLVADAAKGSVTLRWTDRSDNEQGFKIERAEKIRGKYKFSLVDDSINADVTTYSDSVASGTYKYRVQAYSDSNVSDYSNVSSVRIK
jgi:PKD repeat protein